MSRSIRGAAVHRSVLVLVAVLALAAAACASGSAAAPAPAGPAGGGANSGALEGGQPAAAPSAGPAQAVDFEGRDGTRITGWLMLPAQAPQGAVVALHGCGGLYARTGPRQGQLSARHQAMGEMLVGQGYAVLFPDSFTARGVGEVCTQPLGNRRPDAVDLSGACPQNPCRWPQKFLVPGRRLPRTHV